MTDKTFCTSTRSQLVLPLNKLHSAFSRYIKDEFLSSYNSVCTTPGCYSCEG